MSPTVFTKYTHQKEAIWQQYRSCLAVAEYQILGGRHFLILGPKSKNVVVEEGTVPSEKVPLPMDPLEFVPASLALDRTAITAVSRACTLASRTASREHVVPTEWQVRTVLGDCISKAKVISLRAPPYRQYTLVSDFLDLANLQHTRRSSIGHELDQ